MKDTDIVMISMDRNMLVSESAVQKRIRAYSTLFRSMHIIVFATKRQCRHLGVGKSILVEPNIYVYPTQSFSRWFHVLRARSIGNSLFEEKKLSSDQAIVSTQDPFECGLAGFFVARRNKTPLLVELHTDITSPYFSSENFLNRIRLLISRVVLPKASVVRTVNTQVARHLTTRGILEVALLPIHIDVSRIDTTKIDSDFAKKYKKWKHRILMASRLSSEKDIETGIRAFVKIASRHPNTALIIVGDGKKKKSLVRLAKSFSVSERIFFEPWIADLFGVYKTADIFLNTSLYEGYCMTIIEAGAAGCAVVTTNVGIAPELASDIVTFSPRDTERAARLLDEYLSDEEKRKTGARLLYSRVKRDAISFEEHIRRYGEIVEVVKKSR